jgi:serine phosphatase RsbU (regulator of sigma subunit)
MLPVAAALIWTATGLPERPFTGFVLRGERVEVVVPGSPAARAGLRPGDRLVSPAASAPSAGGLVAGLVAGHPTTWTVEREGRQRMVWLVPAHLPRGEFRLFALLLMVACGFLLLASVVWAERRDALTQTFYLLSLAFAMLVAPMPVWRDPRSALLYESAYAGITLFLPALFVHFFALFPEGARPGRRLGFGVAAGYALASAFFAANLAPLLLPRGLAVAAEPLIRAIEGAAALWFAAGLLGALALFARSFGAAASPDARRRLRVALAGTLLGVAPLVAVILVRNLSPGTQLPGERAVVPMTLLVPASFAWAIVVHRIFDVRVALRAAAAVGVLAGGAVVTMIAADEIGFHRGRAAADGLASVALAAMALGALLAGGVASLLRHRAALLAGPAEDLGDSARSRGGSKESLLEAACLSLASELRLDGCAALSTGPGRPRTLAHVGTLVPGALSEGFARELRASGTPLALEEAALEAADRDALELAGVRWVLPLGEPVEHALLLGRRLAGSWLDRHELRDLARFGDHLETLLENLVLRRTASSHVALDRELREARSIQAHLLPRRVPAYPTLDCAAAALSSEPVGGDYYDFVETRDREFTLAVGDAAGKGVPAALLLAGVQARFRSEARRGLRPSALLGALNHQLLQHDQPEKFVGLLCASVDVRRARIGFANAGLTPPLVRRRDGRFEELTSGGVLLGVRDHSAYSDDWVELAAGDVAVLYTDGLTEARCGDEMFGIERVQEVLDRNAGRRASDLLSALLVEVRAFADQPLDDLTVVVLRQLTDPLGARVRAA